MRRVLSFGRRAWRDRSGVVALEFGLIAPVMLSFIMGTVEVTNAFREQAKLNIATGALAELIASQYSVTAPSGTLADICKGAMMNLTPYNRVSVMTANIVSLSNDHPSARVSGSTDSTTVHTYLDWENDSSCAATSASALGLVGAFPLANAPGSMLTKSGVSAANSDDTMNLQYGYSIIVVQTQYTYNNLLKFFLGSKIYFSAVAVARPRSNVTIQCTKTDKVTACPATQ